MNLSKQEKRLILLASILFLLMSWGNSNGQSKTMIALNTRLEKEGVKHYKRMCKVKNCKMPANNNTGLCVIHGLKRKSKLIPIF